MKKTLALLIALLLPALAVAQQGAQPITLGWTPGILSTGATSVAINSATKRVCQGFVATDSKTLSTVTAYFSGKTGSPIAADIKWTLRADSAGLPSTDIEEEDTSATPTTSAFNTSAAFSSALTPGTRYWLCLRNANGTPASNYVTVPFPASNSEGKVGTPWVHGSHYQYGWAGGDSSDSGSTFVSASTGVIFMKFVMSDASVLGFSPLGNQFGDESGAGCRIYGTQEAGAKFTLPADGPGVNVKCLSARLTRTGTVPSGGLRFRLYTGTNTTPTDTTWTVANTNIVYDGYYYGCFATPITVAAGTDVRVTAGAVSGGDSSNYLMIQRVQFENAADAKAQTAFGGSQLTCLASGSWTDTSDKVPPYGVTLNTADPFNVTTGSAQRTKFNQGLN